MYMTVIFQYFAKFKELLSNVERDYWQFSNNFFCSLSFPRGSSKCTLTRLFSWDNNFFSSKNLFGFILLIHSSILLIDGLRIFFLIFFDLRIEMLSFTRSDDDCITEAAFRQLKRFSFLLFNLTPLKMPTHDEWRRSARK